MGHTAGLSYEFEEVPLIIGTTSDEPKKPLRIALITGTCEIGFSGKGETLSWDIASVTISSPIKDDPDVPIRYVRRAQVGHEIWQWVTDSIIAACGDRITEKIDEQEG